MPDSSLRVKLCFFFCHYSGSARRSRMTAGVNYVFLGNKKSPFGEAFYYFFYKNIYFPMNKIVSMYMRRLTFLVCPVSALINV